MKEAGHTGLGGSVGAGSLGSAGLVISAFPIALCIYTLILDLLSRPATPSTASTA